MHAQLVCAISGLISTAGCVVSTFWNIWALSSTDSDIVLGPIWAWKGLWGYRSQIEDGQYNCYEQGPLLLQDRKYCLRSVKNIHDSNLCCKLEGI